MPDQIEFFTIIAPLARDLRRIDPAIVDAWQREVDPPADVRKLSAVRHRR